MYASGLATEEEIQQVEAAMQYSGEVLSAVESCLHDMELYVLMQAVQPPPDLRTMVLNADLDMIPAAKAAGSGQRPADCN
ncbi:hypothetical protein DCC81_12695 [Chitinophaga parva]|uniref:Uncharacterized protein n=2 Tax=Chitinophaga parva TaxID=2169414 RepID=A0A2T7BFU9_9BACT|nr:hypothetical protein DCC81_12695 [Chitinophaga parva]